MLRIRIGLAVLFSSLSAAAAEAPNTLRAAIEPATIEQGSIEGMQPNAAPERERASSETPRESTKDAAAAAAHGELSAFGISPAIPRHAAGLALGGYDGAARSFRARSAAEARIFSPLSLRVEYDYGPGTGPTDRVALGLHGVLLNQARHGLDLGVVALYQPRDFRDEGNVVVGLLLARSFDRFTLVLNPLVGSDPEGDDQSFEARLAALYRLSPRFVLGLDSRGRYNLTEDEKRAGTAGIDWELQSGLSAAFGTGPLLLSALIGPSLLQRSTYDRYAAPNDRNLHTGLLALAGAGATF